MRTHARLKFQGRGDAVMFLYLVEAPPPALEPWRVTFKHFPDGDTHGGRRSQGILVSRPARDVARRELVRAAEKAARDGWRQVPIRGGKGSAGARRELPGAA